jgi:hypothetical protein
VAHESLADRVQGETVAPPCNSNWKGDIVTKLNREEVLFTALFGALWGVIEVVPGTILHMARMPMRGFILAFSAAVILVCAKEFARYRGSLILIGAVAASFKAMSAGGFVLTPVLAIILESIACETVYLLPGFKPIKPVIAGAAVMLYTFLHSIAAQLIFFGMNIFDIYNEMLIKTFGKMLNGNYVVIVLTAFALAHIIAGAIAGYLGKRISEQTKLQLSKADVYE